MEQKQDAPGRNQATPRATVLYNAECPICSREIAVYRRAAERDGLPLAFQPLHEADLDAWGLTDEAARRRLHLRLPDGKLHAGIPAFVALWARMPRMRWLARLVALPVVRSLAGLMYDKVLAPALFALDRRRTARNAANGPG